ncbi:MAG: efflux RND transporter periplasmic adaptor subunit [Bacillota bacterium]|nr:efflux RND transporter periplasmic adaptor subunit [Bacillota bacterium]
MWAVLAVLGLFVALLPGCGTEEQTAQDEVESTVPVIVAEATSGDLELVSDFTGIVEPEMVVNVVHRSGGKVMEVMVKDGDKVQAGAVLIRLDAAEISAQVSQAEAAYRLVQAQYEAAASSLEDTRALYDGEVVSRQQLQQAETQYKIVEAQTAQAAAGLQLARIQLDNTYITAPIGGTVSGVTVNPGEMVSPGMPVATINKLEMMEVRVQLTEKDVGRIAGGQKVDVFVSAVSFEPLEGEVVNISPVADPRTRTYQMKVALTNADVLLKGGMTAVIRVTVAVERDTVIVPVEAVLTQQGRHVVYIVEDRVAKRRFVTIGLENGNAASVLEGVIPGEQVVVSGQHYLQDADKVTVAGGGAN